MHLGVLPRSSKARSYLMPIRGELSAIAWILSLGRVVPGSEGTVIPSSRGLLLEGTTGFAECVPPLD